MPKLRSAKTLRTGGTAAALDSIAGGSITDGDVTLVHETTNVIYPYAADADAGGAESNPWVIVPDTAPGNINHILLTVYPIVRTSYDLYFKQEFLDKDIIFQINDGGVTKTPITIDASENEVVFDCSVRFASSSQFLKPYEADVADDGTISLPDATAGFCDITFDEGAAWARIRYTNAGVVEIIQSGPYNEVKNSDTDGYYCVYQDGTTVKIKNRKGVIKNVKIFNVSG